MASSSAYAVDGAAEGKELQEVGSAGAVGEQAMDRSSAVGGVANQSAGEQEDGQGLCCGGLYINNPAGKWPRIFFEWIFIGQLIGFGIAVGVYYGDKDRYDMNIDAMFPSGTDGIFVSLSLFLLATVMYWINVMPLRYKGEMYGWEMGENLWSNMYVYKTMDSDKLHYMPSKKTNVLMLKKAKAGSNVDLETGGHPQPPTLVCLEHNGVVGKMNRANRSMHHMVENSFSVLMLGYMLAKLFPLPTLIASILWSIGRIGHQYMYAEKGYGLSKHLPYSALESTARQFFHGQLLVVALRCSGAF